MSAMASQITSLTTVHSTGYSGVDQRIHQSSASLALVRGIHWWSVNSPHKGPITRKMFPFNDVIMHLLQQNSASTNACLPLWDNPGHRFSHYYAQFELEMFRGIFVVMADNHIFDHPYIVHEVINRHFSVHNISISSRLKHNFSSIVSKRLQFR